MAEDYLNLIKTINSEIQEAKNSRYKKMKRSISWYIIIKLFKTSDKDKLLKASREKQIGYIQRNKDNNENRLLIEKKCKLNDWSDTFKELYKKLSTQTSVTTTTKSFKNESDILTFLDIKAKNPTQ